MVSEHIEYYYYYCANNVKSLTTQYQVSKTDITLIGLRLSYCLLQNIFGLLKRDFSCCNSLILYGLK